MSVGTVASFEGIRQSSFPFSKSYNFLPSLTLLFPSLLFSLSLSLLLRQDFMWSRLALNSLYSRGCLGLCGCFLNAEIPGVDHPRCLTLLLSFQIFSSAASKVTSILTALLNALLTGRGLYCLGSHASLKLRLLFSHSMAGTVVKDCPQVGCGMSWK